jgi:hypothetical protein
LLNNKAPTFEESSQHEQFSFEDQLNLLSRRKFWELCLLRNKSSTPLLERIHPLGNQRCAHMRVTREPFLTALAQLVRLWNVAVLDVGQRIGRTEEPPAITAKCRNKQLSQKNSNTGRRLHHFAQRNRRATAMSQL